MNKEKISLKVIRHMLSETARNKPQLFFCYFINLLVEIIRKIQIIIIPKFIIDELLLVYNGRGGASEEGLKKIIFYVAVLLGLMLLGNLLQSITDRITSCVREWFNEYFQVKITEQTMSLDYECTEDPEVLDQMNKAKEGMDWYSGNVCGILDQFFSIVTNVIVLAGVIAVIWKTSPLIIPLEVLSLAVISFFNKKIQQIEIQSFHKLSKENRIFSYLFFEISDFNFGKDIRLYNSSELFNKSANEHLDKEMKSWINQAEGSKKQQYSINIVNALSNGVSYIYIGYQAIRKIITLGDFSMGISASTTFSQCCDNVVMAIQEIIKRSNYVNEYLKYMEYPGTLPSGVEKVKDVKGHEIEFRNVFFKYPRSQDYILKNINIKIPSGQHLAVVGLNGAGKTTFIKLLCRLYDVTAGEILIDGINIKEYQKDEYIKLIAVLFQDFKLFAFSLRENISFNNKTPDEDIDRVLKLVGLYDDAQKLPAKNDTCLSKEFDTDGVDLSGGQKQKTAIARVIYKDAPIVILDEPTAALDPFAEAEIYEGFNKMVRGKTAIYISHRLSSCKFCDQIAVFSDNTIKEYGSHSELINIKDGIYQKMFTTQARQYRKNKLEN